MKLSLQDLAKLFEDEEVRVLGIILGCGVCLQARQGRGRRPVKVGNGFEDKNYRDV